MSDRAAINRLVNRARGGDAAALAELCEAYLPRLRNFFLRLGAGGESDDLTQQTLIKLIENIGKIRMGGSFESWLYRVAYNLFIDARRRRSAQPLGEWDAPSSAPTPPEHVEMAERFAHVYAAIDILDDESRAMMILRYWREMSYIEIARTLGVTPVRVKWRLHAALNKLRCALKEELK